MKPKNKGFYVVRPNGWDWYPTRRGAMQGAKEHGGVVMTAEQYERQQR